MATSLNVLISLGLMNLYFVWLLFSNNMYFISGVYEVMGSFVWEYENIPIDTVNTATP